MESPREFDRVVDCDLAKLGIRHRTGICAEAKDRRVLTRERVRECGAVCEIRVQNLLQFGVRDAKHPPSDCCHKSDSGMTERVAEGMAADHSSRPNYDKSCLVRRRKIHDSTRSSSQSTYSRRSANSHVPSIFAKVSR